MPARHANPSRNRPRPSRDRERAVRPSRRAAFTLVEMLVALAILTVAMAVVAQVFAITAGTARSAAAIAEVEAAVRNFTIQLQQDLAGIDRTQSILVLVGRTQQAGRVADDIPAGKYWRVLTGDPDAVPAGFDPEFAAVNPSSSQYSDPRADLMMFFVQQPQPSRAPATAGLSASTTFESMQRALQRGTKFAPAQIVYGHAAISTVTPLTGGGYDWSTPVHIADEQSTPAGGLISRIAASRWVLARRTTLLLSNLYTESGDQGYTFQGVGNDPDASGTGAVGEFPRILRCYNGSPRFPDEQRWAADAVNFDFEAFIANFNVGMSLSGPNSAAESSPYTFPNGALNQPAWPLEARKAVFGTLYPNNQTDDPRKHIATVVNDPPAELQTNLALQALPGCAWFQVEFLLPEDPRNGLDHPLTSVRTDMERWCEVDSGATYVFVPDNAENRAEIAATGDTNGDGVPEPGTRAAGFAPLTSTDTRLSNRIIRIWPYAIRVTIRVFDREGRLQEPLVRRIVHRFD
ncbi:MAG: prepilin-type N-terminal cleavage/methylation domain-containing protein [Phycisphaerae bacterium]|jgi:prepilin-type N-terminal cleavage/methylation domain-containing protein